MARYNSLDFLLSKRVLTAIILLGCIPVVGTVLLNTPSLRWLLFWLN